MRKELIEIVCCPDCRNRLHLQGAKEDEHGDVLTGTLRCTQCAFGYPIEDGIPNLLPPAFHVRKGKKAAGESSKMPAAKDERRGEGGVDA